jgi:hypothetical protein
MNVPYYLLRSIHKMSYRVQAKSKDVDSSLFHSELIRMLVSEDLGKKEISWENFVVTSHFKMDPTPTPQSHIAFPSASTSNKVGISKKRKGRVPVSEINKQVMEAKEEICPSPHRDFLPPPPPGLEEVPSSTKFTSKRGKKLPFLILLQQSKSRVKDLSLGHQFLRRFSKSSLYQNPLCIRRKEKELKSLWRRNKKTLFIGRRVKVPKDLWRGNMKSL